MSSLQKTACGSRRTTRVPCRVGSLDLPEATADRGTAGTAFLDKSLFTSYSLTLPEAEEGAEPELPCFQINLTSLLEALQIFGAVDVASRAQRAENEQYRSNIRNYRPDAFSHQALGISGTCCFVYENEGALSIIIEESGVKTTANLVTYLPEMPDEIPFDREDLAFKIIMPARHLLDAMTELATTGTDKLSVTVSRAQPYLLFSGQGELGSSSVDFARGKDILETFSMQDKRWVQKYKFDLIKSSTEAMRIASKVAFRGDRQGVLNWNFMVDVDGRGKSFLTFKFVPYATIDGDEDTEEED